MDENLLPIDFEFNSTNEKYLNLVSGSLQYSLGKKYTCWLHNEIEEHQALKELLLTRKNDIFLSFNVISEARSLLSLGIDPRQFKWIDLYLEYRCLTNHNNELAYGKQLKDGKVKYTRPPVNKYAKSQEEEEDEDSSKPDRNLAAACFKLLGVMIDTEQKDRIRDLIISSPRTFTEEQQKEILQYNESDVKYLIPLYHKILEHYGKLLKNKPLNLMTLKEEMLLRGEYAARSAIMESVGYPVDVGPAKYFSSQVPEILYQCQTEINKLFPTITPFKIKVKCRPKELRWDQNATRAWIATTPYVKWWMKTDTKQISLKLDAFKKFYNFSHSYPEDSFGAQIVRYLTLKRNLNGFLPGGKSGSFWDYVGSDGRARPYMGIYGAQSARSQPKATGFLFLKSAMFRCLELPKKGRAIAGIDYKSQEFLLAALISNDAVMLKAYQSGDPYLYLAKLAGKVPWDGVRGDYEVEREVFKTCCLAMQYGMKEVSLAGELTEKLATPFSVPQASNLIHIYNKNFLKFYIWRQSILGSYARNKYIKLPCGWYMWGDNPSNLSVGNVPIQGFGSSIMRKAVGFAQDSGLEVIKTLHDAIYIEYDSHDFAKIDILGKAMDEAFRFYFPEKIKPLASVGLEANTWSQDYTDMDSTTPAGLPLKVQQKYFDKRGRKEYEKFKKYFTPEESLFD